MVVGVRLESGVVKVGVVDRGEAAEVVESSLVKSGVGGAACSSHGEVVVHVSCHVFVGGVEGGLITSEVLVG